MIKRFFAYYIPHKKLFYIDFFSAIVVALLDLAFPVVVQWFINTLLPEQEWGTVIWVSGALFATYLISSYLQYNVNFLGHKLGINIETDMRQDLFEGVQRQSFKYFDNTKTGHIISRITNDLFDIGELAHHGPEDLFIALMTFAGAFGIMFYVNPSLALVALVFVPVLIALITYTNIKMNKAWTKMYSEIGDVNARVEDSVSGMRVVQSFTNEEHEVETFRANNSRYRKAKVGGYKVMGYTSSGIFLATRLMILSVLIYGSWLLYVGTIDVGEFVLFILYINILFKPIEKISAILELYPRGMAGFKRFTDMMDTEVDVVDRDDAKEAPVLDGSISFNDVTFGYEENRPVLSNVNLTIPAGKTIAFVGPSGAGKTTISSLIPRFYDIDSGSITINGMNIQEMTKKSLRSQIGIVQQDVFLFSGTLRENIRYGNLNASDEEIEHAARLANLEALIESLPQGYDTQIGQRGLKLSGGQKQRIAIARTFLKNPPILILDEATSALDTETEAMIQQSLQELAVNRTTLVIAHRLATIRHADRIVVVTKDGIVEQGTYDELIAKNGAFASLNSIQINQ
ncbi:ATP-binding cassette subfamily B protein [Alkalihalobacillus xiaoxiensis]|uniref:ATP-binding cassette subfamily B protein n=1 Tax=Shouchella xiaoxiensis TaxID=766895 RepID=A0ABS2T0R4_9BACI|nr:ABC transporter ATP-binding protein [Shouchella xiaoxiensis]MBM7841345.1 ATP-binding cassette subfamily B protein [Shouchella xiaoxiensis]